MENGGYATLVLLPTGKKGEFEGVSLMSNAGISKD